MSCKSNQPASGITLKDKREIAKVGMAASMGALVATGLLGGNKTRRLKNTHLISSVALIGFSVWHASLYGHPSSK